MNNKRKRIYTEIRIGHDNEEQKKEFELKLNKALRKKGYCSRTEYIRQQIRELLK